MKASRLISAPFTRDSEAQGREPAPPCKPVPVKAGTGLRASENLIFIDHSLLVLLHVFRDALLTGGEFTLQGALDFIRGSEHQVGPDGQAAGEGEEVHAAEERFSVPVVRVPPVERDLQLLGFWQLLGWPRCSLHNSGNWHKKTLPKDGLIICYKNNGNERLKRSLLWGVSPFPWPFPGPRVPKCRQWQEGKKSSRRG